MKMIKCFIQIVFMFVLLATFFAQITISNEQDQRGICIEEAFPAGKITDRHAFFVGALFAELEIDYIRYKEILCTPRDQKDILEGFEGVSVTLEGVNPKAEKYGLTQQLLQNDTELRLRQNGIKVFTHEEALKNYAHRLVERNKKNLEILKTKVLSLKESFNEKDSDEHFLQSLREIIQHSEKQKTSSLIPPSLYINVNAIVLEESHRTAFSIEVSVQEGSRLSRNGASCVATIWETGGVGTCSSSDLKEYIRGCLRDYLDEFINDYLAANPKDQSSDGKQ